MYKLKLIALLEGLECQKIPELTGKSCEHLRRIGEEIAKYAKIGSAQPEDSAKCKCETDFAYEYDPCNCRLHGPNNG